MDWHELKSIKIWTPLKNILYPVVKLTDGLYQIEKEKYLIVVPYNQKLEKNADAPFITALLWASTEGAAKRAQSGQIEADQDVSGREPPLEMLPGKGICTYAGIIDELKSRKISFLESGRYRIANDGAFIHRVIETDVFEFYFRNNEDDMHEIPYAIRYRLSK